MGEEESKNRLGTGLSALLGGKKEYVEEDKDHSFSQSSKMIRAVRVVPIESVERNESNPRKSFCQEELKDLADSIKEKDIIQPILVRFVNKPETGIRYQIIAGERRWRAAQMAGLETVPVIEINVDDVESAELALIENVQRTDLNAIEEAYAYKKLMQYKAINANELAPVVGKSRSHILNMIRLLNLPQEVQDFLVTGKLTTGHARAIINVPNVEDVAQKIIKQNLSVRQTEKLVHHITEDNQLKQVSGQTEPMNEGDIKSHSHKVERVQIEKIEKEISDYLGLKTKITIGKNGGTLVLRYNNFDQFEKLCEKLMKSL